MHIFNWLRPAPKPIIDNPPSYKASEAAVYTYRFITAIKSISNAAFSKSQHTMELYINTANYSRKLMKAIEKNNEEKTMKYFYAVRYYSDNLFANTNLPVLHKELYTAREIFRNIEVILNEK